jgi:hypothetical protein
MPLPSYVWRGLPASPGDLGRRALYQRRRQHQSGAPAIGFDQAACQFAVRDELV